MKNNQSTRKANLHLFLIYAVATLLFTTAALPISLAADGDLDTSFDGDGRVATDFTGDDVATESLLLPNGKIIALGLIGDGSRNGLARYNADGSLDATFGTGGKVAIDDSTSINPIDQITAIRLQPDGKIVGSTSDGYIVRLNANGSLDATLNSGSPNIPNGTRRVTINRENFVFYDVAIQPDGKYVFATSTIVTTPTFATIFALVRCNADGTVDTSFGAGGVLTTNAPRGVAEAVEISADNKIVVAGYTDETPNNATITAAVLRYNLDGTPDATFSGDGKAFVNRQDVIARSTKLAVHTDGRIAVAQNYNDPNFPVFYVAKFNADGSPDSSFGTNGIVNRTASAYGVSFMFKILFQPDGKILAFGQAQPRLGDGNYGFLVARYNLNGAPDSTFGTNGSVVTQFFYTVNTQTRVAIGQANSGLLQTDGKIVAVGHADFSNPNGFKNFALVRLYNSNAPTLTPQVQRFSDFDNDGKADASVFRSGTWFVNPSGNANAFYGAQFGLPTDKLAPADYDGDGKTDIAVWRDEPSNPDKANFYIFQSQTNTVRVEQFGRTGDNPVVVGDWDNDGKADAAVYRRVGANGGQSYFFYRPSNQPTVSFISIPWGTAGDKPMRGDFDGDGRFDAAVFRPSNNVWYILQSSNNQIRYDNWGLASDRFVPNDYDGDKKTDLAVYRSGVWYIKQSTDSQTVYKFWGTDGDALAPADYDGDGKTDAAVFRNGIFYILQSTNDQPKYVYFGASGDTPVASAFVQ